MSRWLPYPLQALLLLEMWIVLARSLSVGTVLIGLVVALAGVQAVRLLELPATRVRRPWAIVRLFCRVVSDVVASNMAVAGIILGPSRPSMRSGFMDIPLTMRSPYGLMMLAVIITATPGTLWVNFNSATGLLTIHVLDLQDEQAWVSTIQKRYESLLLEIFE